MILAIALLLLGTGLSVFVWVGIKSSFVGYRAMALDLVERSEQIRTLIDQEKRYNIEKAMFYVGSRGGYLDEIPPCGYRIIQEEIPWLPEDAIPYWKDYDCNVTETLTQEQVVENVEVLLNNYFQGTDLFLEEKIERILTSQLGNNYGVGTVRALGSNVIGFYSLTIPERNIGICRSFIDTNCTRRNTMVGGSDEPAFYNLTQYIDFGADEIEGIDSVILKLYVSRPPKEDFQLGIFNENNSEFTINQYCNQTRTFYSTCLETDPDQRSDECNFCMEKASEGALSKGCLRPVGCDLYLPRNSQASEYFNYFYNETTLAEESEGISLFYSFYKGLEGDNASKGSITLEFSNAYHNNFTFVYSRNNGEIINNITIYDKSTGELMYDSEVFNTEIPSDEYFIYTDEINLPYDTYILQIDIPESTEKISHDIDALGLYGETRKDSFTAFRMEYDGANTGINDVYKSGRQTTTADFNTPETFIYNVTPFAINYDDELINRSEIRIYHDPEGGESQPPHISNVELIYSSNIYRGLTFEGSINSVSAGTVQATFVPLRSKFVTIRALSPSGEIMANYTFSLLVNGFYKTDFFSMLDTGKRMVKNSWVENSIVDWLSKKGIIRLETTLDDEGAWYLWIYLVCKIDEDDFSQTRFHDFCIENDISVNLCRDEAEWINPEIVFNGEWTMEKYKAPVSEGGGGQTNFGTCLEKINEQLEYELDNYQWLNFGNFYSGISRGLLFRLHPLEKSNITFRKYPEGSVLFALPVLRWT